MLGTAGVLFAGSDPNLLYELNGTDAADALGYSVGGGGDVNGDGRADFIIGVPFANPNGIINAGSAFIYSGFDGSLLDSVHGTSPGDRVGGSVGLQGDIDGDGKGDYIVGAPGVNNLAGAAYVYSGATGLLMYQITGSSPGERVGGSVGIYGDVDGDGKGDFIVGAPGFNNSTGAAYVYSGATGLLIYQKIGGVIGDRVGGSVGIYGDVNADGRADFIVGAPGTNNSTGSAYVYSGLDGSLIYQKDGLNAGDRVGGSVGIYGDVNADGHGDFIVGAPDADPGGLTDAGSAYVYSGLDGSLLYQKNGGAPGDRVGGSVGIQGDVNADGKSDFIIGAPQADPGGLLDAGSIFVYSGLNGSLLYQKNGFSAGDRVGGSVGIMADADGDANAEFIVGAPIADSGVGLAYVYSGATGNLLYQRNGTSGGENFGWSVASAGDVDGDSIPDFIVGSPSADPGGLIGAGSAYVYSGADGFILYQKDGSAAGDGLGVSVAGAGDVNGDGKADFIIGAPGASPSGIFSAGSAYVYSGADGSILYQKDGAAAGDVLGNSVAGAGDVNGDGYCDFIIGAKWADPGGLEDAGSTYIYSGATGALIYQKDGTFVFVDFGFAVARLGDLNGDARDDFIVGAPYAGGFAEGKAFVYSGATGTLLFQKSGIAANENLGSSVAGAGDVNKDGMVDFIVGAPYTDPGGLRGAGSAFVYSGTDGSLLFQKDGTTECANLGYSVAGAGDVSGDGKDDFLIGALRLAFSGGDGSAFVYSGADGALLFRKNGSPGDGLGFSVAGTGDINGDGRADFMIGAPGSDPAGLIDAGTALIYTLPSNTAAPSLEPVADQDLLLGNSTEFNIQASDPDGIVFLFAELLPAGAVFVDSLNGRGHFFWIPALAQAGSYVIRLIASDGLHADTQNVTFTVTVDTLAGLLALYQINGDSIFTLLGYSVAGAGDMNGDGKADFIVGSPFADPGGLTDAGSAYLYSGATGVLLFQKNGNAGDELGWSVAGTGDVNGDVNADFIIGARGANNYVGSVYVYSGADGSLLFQKNGAAASDQLGFSVAGAGDANADGKADFIVGAPFADPGGFTDAGSAFVYSGADGSLLFQKDATAADDRLGTSVAGCGDVNADGKDDFIIGAPEADPGGLYFAGSAFVYSGADGHLLFQKDGDDGYLGNSVAGAGDVNGDGFDDFIIGAPYAIQPWLNSQGAAFVYSGADGSLLFQKDGAGGVMGFSVAGAGDVNGDGKADFIVGAFGADPGGLSGAGSAYVYSGADGSLFFQKNGTAASDNLGYSVAGAGDVNGDGKADFIIGAPYSCGTAAYVYGLPACVPAKGDMDCDGILKLEDVVLLLNCTFLGEGDCSLSFADVNCDGILTASDVVLELNKVFLNIPFPCP